MQQKCSLISQLKQQGDTKPNLHDVLTAAISCYAWDTLKIARLTKPLQYERWLVTSDKKMSICFILYDLSFIMTDCKA